MKYFFVKAKNCFYERKTFSLGIEYLVFITLLRISAITNTYFPKEGVLNGSGISQSEVWKNASILKCSILCEDLKETV